MTKICLSCKKEFESNIKPQKFCTRRCFKQDYYSKQKQKERDENSRFSKFPIKHCDLCGRDTQLDFDPKKHFALFNGWECPHCHVPNKMLWKYHNTPNSRAVIMQFLISQDNGATMITGGFSFTSTIQH